MDYSMPAKEITQERFDDMLEVMPPLLWRNAGNTESFMLCEAYINDWHLTFCRIGQKYYEMRVRNSLTHQEIVSLVN